VAALVSRFAGRPQPPNLADTGQTQRAGSCSISCLNRVLPLDVSRHHALARQELDCNFAVVTRATSCKQVAVEAASV
jgi:hypothetical protein